jgi:hypothetical protein
MRSQETYEVESKTEYLKCDFSAPAQEERDVRLDGQVVPKKDTFRYLGSMLYNIQWRLPEALVCSMVISQTDNRKKQRKTKL